MKLFLHVFNVCEGKADAARGGGGRCWWESPSHMFLFPSLCAETGVTNTCTTRFMLQMLQTVATVCHSEPILRGSKDDTTMEKQTNKRNNSRLGTTSRPKRLRNYLNGFSWTWLKTTDVGISAYATSHFLFCLMHLERGDAAHSTSCLISCL